jgi:CRP-like cAMP-binding protein
MIEPMRKRETVGVLGEVPLFANLPEKELRRLSKNLTERTFESGAEIAVEGREGLGFFVIESGEATVSRGGEEVGRLGPGDYFGEMALIDGGPRSATVIADTQLRCRAMTEWAFRPLVESHAEIAWPLLQALVGRLRETEGRSEA